MTDMLDQAQQLEEMARAEGVRLVNAAMAATGSAHCVTCGDAISAARRAALPAATRCIDCQARAEGNRRVAGPPHYQPVEIFRGRGC